MLVYCFSPRVPFVTQCLLLQSNLSSICMKICKDIVGLYLHCCFLQTAFPNNRLFAVIVHVLITGETCCQQIPCEKIACDAGYYWMQLYAEKSNPNLGESFFFLLLPKTPLVFWNSFLCKQFPTLNQIHLSLWWSLSWSTQIGFPLIFIFGDSRFSMWTAKVITAARPVWSSNKTL